MKSRFRPQSLSEKITDHVAVVVAVTFLVIVLLFGLIGWVWNITTLYHMDFSVLTGEIILRIVGIFVAPLGAILGFI